MYQASKGSVCKTFNIWRGREKNISTEKFITRVLSVIYFVNWRLSSSDCAIMFLSCQQVIVSVLKRKKYYLKKQLQLAIQDFLLSPLYLVLTLSIHILSLVFLYCVSLLIIFSKIVTSMSEILCPGKLKWYPVDL